MSDIRFQGFWRMDWGLGNPNKTAALIAMIMVAVWVFACMRRRGFWISLTLFTVLGICLVHTFSRGGIVAAFAGLVPLAIVARRPWPWFMTCGFLLSVGIILSATIYLQAHKRYAQGVVEKDQSIENRLALWKVAPSMMVDAPDGWGIGQSGNAFMNWYQPLEHNEGYRTLVSSHLTWLVEIGWIGRIFYVFSWLFILAWCFPYEGAHWTSAIGFSVWVSFAVACIFSSVGESAWLWAIPVAFLATVSTFRIRQCKFIRLKDCTHLVLATAIFVTFLFSIGSVTRTGLIRFQNGVVFWGRDEKLSPTVWILPDEKVFGAYYGRNFRRQINGNITAAFLVKDVSNTLFPKPSTLVFGARADPFVLRTAHEWLDRGGKLFPLNTRIHPFEFSKMGANPQRITVAFGEFSDSPTKASWTRRYAEKIEICSGMADFLPYWPTLLNDEL